MDLWYINQPHYALLIFLAVWVIRTLFEVARIDGHVLYHDWSWSIAHPWQCLNIESGTVQVWQSNFFFSADWHRRFSDQRGLLHGGWMHRSDDGAMIWAFSISKQLLGTSERGVGQALQSTVPVSKRECRRNIANIQNWSLCLHHSPWQ